MGANKSARVLIIAEVGSVHDGSYGNAGRLIQVAKDCGADAVKFQTHIAGEETVRNAPPPPYFSDEPRFDYFERTGFSAQQWRGIKRTCEEVGIEFMSSPFSEKAVELLESLDMRRYKIPSGEVTNTPMIKRVCATGKPILLSTGMSNWRELDKAVDVIRAGGNDFILMQCSSQYPCPSENVGLNVIDELRRRYAVEAGFSDHTDTNAAAYAAVTLGAVAVEKHLTFSRAMYGSDAKHAAEPAQFADLVRGIREIEQMLAHPVDKDDTAVYEKMKQIFQKSVVARRDIRRGEKLTRDNLALKKPGTGLPPERLDALIGRTAARDIERDELIHMDALCGK